MPKTSPIHFLDILFSEGSCSLKWIKMIDHLLGGLIVLILPEQKKVMIIPASVRKILVIRPGGIGDAVFLLPILKVLRLKGIVIDILCEPRNREVFASQDYAVYSYWQWNSLHHILTESYDAVIDTEQWHYLSGILGYFVKTRHRIGFATRRLRAKLFNKPVVYGIDEYELNNFLKLFEDLLPDHLPIEDLNDSFDLPLAVQEWAERQIPKESQTIFLGGSLASKRISMQQTITIVENLLVQNISPVLLGGRDVSGPALQIIQRVNNPRVLNFTGKLSLIQSAALIQRSQRLIAPDSGLMHLACAMGKPVIAIFGPSHLDKWQPKGNQHTIVTEKVSCSPCTRFGYALPTCQGAYHCMKNIGLNKENLAVGLKK